MAPNFLALLFNYQLFSKYYFTDNQEVSFYVVINDVGFGAKSFIKGTVAGDLSACFWPVWMRLGLNVNRLWF